MQNLRICLKLSELMPGEEFYWDSNMNFGGQYIRSTEKGILILEYGCDGNSPHEEIREDCRVWVDAEF